MIGHPGAASLRAITSSIFGGLFARLRDAASVAV